MSDTVKCPYCGGRAHKLCFDGRYQKYVCEHCRGIFIVE